MSNKRRSMLELTRGADLSAGLPTEDYECAGKTPDGRLYYRAIGSTTILGVCDNGTTSDLKDGDGMMVVRTNNGLRVLARAPGRRKARITYAV